MKVLSVLLIFTLTGCNTTSHEWGQALKTVGQGMQYNTYHVNYVHEV